MLSGGYSNRFQQLNETHSEHIKHIHQTERMDMIARNKKLQQETNRRRKAIAIKRKLESQREEKRRQEILNKRREEQHRATEKYQRLNKHFTPDEEPFKESEPFTPPPESPRRTPALEDALKAVRGPSGKPSSQDTFSRQGSSESIKSSSTSSKPPRVSSATSTGGRSNITNSSSTHGPPPGTFYGSDSLNRAYYNKYGAGSTTLNARTAEHARQVAAHTELHSSSLRNLNNSRSLFEAQLEHHQHQLADHHRQALNQFNDAIRKEIDSDVTLHGTDDVDSHMMRSNSVSSADSLEDEQISERTSSLKANSDINLPTHYHHDVRPAGPISQLHASHSDSCLQKYGQNQEKFEYNNQLSKRSNEAPDYEMRPNQGSGSVHQGAGFVNQGSGSVHQGAGFINQGSGSVHQGAGFINQGSGSVHQGAGFINQGSGSVHQGAGFLLHRSVSGNSNVAVVQPISSASQTPSNHIKHPATSVQSGVNTQSPPLTNGYYTSAGGDSGKITTPHPGAAVQGQDVNVIGPISTSNMGRNGTQYQVDQFTNSQASNHPKSFYLGAFTGTNYTVANVEANTENKTLNDDDFHARTKAWTTPTPDVLSPLGEAKAVSSAAVSAGGNNFTNVKPNSTRLTATNTTLTTDSPTVPPYYQNYPLQAAAGGKVQQTGSGIVPGGSGNHGNHVRMNNGGHVTYTNGHQNGVVYSKGSIPSTAIVTTDVYQQNTNVTQHNTNVMQHNATQGPSTPSSVIDTASTIIEDQSTQGEATDASEEDEEPLPEKAIKGILKQTFNANQPYAMGRGRGVRGKGYVDIYQGRGRGRGQAQVSEQVAFRDSIEVAKEHRGEEEKPEKKSVRFAEKLVEEEGENEQEYHPPESTFVKPTVTTTKVTKKPGKVKGKPPRPVSAKVATNTKPAGARQSRASSAGSFRRTPFVRQAPKVTVNKQAPAESGIKFRSVATTATTPTTPTSSIPTSGTKNNPVEGPVKSNMEPVYDGNGLRLDRTPTDDEINWLWDKVRTCLSRNSTMSSQDTQSQTTDQGSVSGRQTATMSSKYIDGNSLAPQFRAATRVNPNPNSMANEKEVTINGTGNYHTGFRKKISMEQLNSYNRKNSSLLAQRKNAVHNQVASPSSASSVGSTTHTTTYQAPSFSSHGPSPATNQPSAEVSESMAAFLTAEALAQHSVSDSHIEDAMETAKQNQRTYNSSKPQHKVPTALSMEEQRLLQSLERLNERLKSHVQKQGQTRTSSSSNHHGTKKHAENREVYVYQNWTEGDQSKSGYRLTETSVAGGTSTYGPKGTQYGRGFRGHQPLTASHRRYHSANSATSEKRQTFRATSANNIHGGNIAYH